MAAVPQKATQRTANAAAGAGAAASAKAAVGGGLRKAKDRSGSVGAASRKGRGGAAATAAAARRSGSAGPDADGGGRRQPAAQRPRVNLISSGAGLEESPRLLPLEESGWEAFGAPLVAEPAESKPERFCVDGPYLGPVGIPARDTRAPAAASEMSFPAVVAWMESCASQASVVLVGRLPGLRLRCLNAAPLLDAQSGDLCEVADGVVAAAYHLQKWAAVLAAAGLAVDGPAAAQGPLHKPSPCESAEEAFALMHMAASRIMVGIAGVKHGLDAAMKAKGDKAEAYVHSLGVPNRDLRALPPHLETCLARLGRLTHRLRKPEALRDFVPRYFAPVLGRKLAERLLLYLGRDAERVPGLPPRRNTVL